MSKSMTQRVSIKNNKAECAEVAIRKKYRISPNVILKDNNDGYYSALNHITMQYFRFENIAAQIVLGISQGKGLETVLKKICPEDPRTGIRLREEAARYIGFLLEAGLVEKID